jgi:hypothetical protein
MANLILFGATGYAGNKVLAGTEQAFRLHSLPRSVRRPPPRC